MAECEAVDAERTIGVQVIFVFCPAWIETLTLHEVISQSNAKIFTRKIRTNQKRSQKEQPSREQQGENVIIPATCYIHLSFISCWTTATFQS